MLIKQQNFTADSEKSQKLHQAELATREERYVTDKTSNEKQITSLKSEVEKLHQQIATLQVPPSPTLSNALSSVSGKSTETDDLEALHRAHTAKLAEVEKLHSAKVGDMELRLKDQADQIEKLTSQFSS